MVDDVSILDSPLFQPVSYPDLSEVRRYNLSKFPKTPSFTGNTAPHHPPRSAVSVNSQSWNIFTGRDCIARGRQTNQWL